MKKPPIYYRMELDEATGVYTGYCPNMKPVRFSGKNEDEIDMLVRDGIKLYLEQHPDFFETYKELEM